MSKSTIHVQKEWAEDMGFEASRLVPLGAAKAVVCWSLPDGSTDGEIGQDVAEVLRRALLSSGRLAFRVDDAPSPPEASDEYHPEPARHKLLAILELFIPSKPRFAVLVTSSLQSSEKIFSYEGWIAAMQAVLVFDEADTDIAPMLEPLQARLDWRGQRLPGSAYALFGSDHDGSFGVLSALNETRLNKIIDDIVSIGGSADIDVRYGPYAP